MSTSEINPLWQLLDPLPIPDAASLIAGIEPHSVPFDSAKERWDNNTTETQLLPKLNATFTSLKHAVLPGRLVAKLAYNAISKYTMYVDLMDIAAMNDISPEQFMKDQNLFDVVSKEVDYYISKTLNWTETTVQREDLTAWLQEKGVRDGFFFASYSEEDGYSSTKSPDFRRNDG